MTKEEKSCRTYGPQYDKFVSSNEEGIIGWFAEPENQEELRKEIDNMTLFLKSQYGIMSKNIEISIYTGKTTDIPRPNYINGVRYELHDITHKILGEIFIVFMVKEDNLRGTRYPYYIFRTEIDKILCSSIDTCKAFTEQIVGLSKELGLKMNTTEEYLRESIYCEPIFYQEQKKVDINSFKQFLENITYIAEFPLKLPKRKQYACESRV